MKRFAVVLGAVSMLAGCDSTGYTVGQKLGQNDEIVVFHLEENGRNGLMATTYDVGGDGEEWEWPETWWVGYRWSHSYTNIPTATGVGLGAQNTSAIVNDQGNPETVFPNAANPRPYAAWLCSSLNIPQPGNSSDPFNDWYLPSIDELELLHEYMKDEFPAAPDRRGAYWSSTQGRDGNDPLKSAMYVNFYDQDGVSTMLKSDRAVVRCVRSF